MNSIRKVPEKRENTLVNYLETNKIYKIGITLRQYFDQQT